MGSMTQSLVSVVIPCYGQAHFLGEAIESVLAQTHRHHEIVVVDDGSPDDTAAVACRYPSVRYVRQENQGLAAARNTGIRRTRGEYLVFLDADDRLLPTHLETNLHALLRRMDAAFVCGDYRWIGADDAWHVHQCAPGPDHYATLLRLNFIGPPIVAMFRREVLNRVGGFRSEVNMAEDQDLYLRLARWYPIYCHHEVVAEYRKHSSQHSQKWDVMLRATLTALRGQRPYASRHRVYRDAYRAGVQYRQRLYCLYPLLAPRRVVQS